MTAEQRRALVVTISWRALVTVLAAITAWDTAGLLLGGDASYQSQSYDVARAFGIRTWGVALAVCLVGVIAGLRRFVAVDRAGLVLWGLSGLTAWSTAWTAAIIATWFYHRDGPVLPAVITAALLLLAAAWLWRHAYGGLGWLLVGAAGAWCLGWGAGLHIPAWGAPSKTAAIAGAAWFAARSLRTARTAEAIAPGRG